MHARECAMHWNSNNAAKKVLRNVLCWEHEKVSVLAKVSYKIKACTSIPSKNKDIIINWAPEEMGR